MRAIALAIAVALVILALNAQSPPRAQAQSPDDTPTPRLPIGPSINLRPVNDVIERDQPGVIEAMLRNPRANDSTMVVDMSVTLPSGIHVTGAEFVTDEGAGVASASYEVPPGYARSISIRIRADRIGRFTIHLTGIYWPKGDKDAFRQFSFTHPFTALAASAPEPEEAPTPPQKLIQIQTPVQSPTQIPAAPTPSPKCPDNGWSPRDALSQEEVCIGGIQVSWPVVGGIATVLCLMMGIVAWITRRQI